MKRSRGAPIVLRMNQILNVLADDPQANRNVLEFDATCGDWVTLERAGCITMRVSEFGDSSVRLCGDADFWCCFSKHRTSGCMK